MRAIFHSICIFWMCYIGCSIGLQSDELLSGPDHAFPPDADTPALRDIMPKVESKFSNSYLPAVMQALAYYVELIQYEPLYTTTIEPPYTLPAAGEIDVETVTTSKPQTSSTRWTTTTSKPTTTTRRPWGLPVESTTQSHKPGQFAPAVQSSTPLHDELVEQLVYKPTTTSKPFVAQVGPLPILSISNHQYFDWYLQNKGKRIQKDPEYELQFLHPLPSGLLQDILYEPYEQPALSESDNINEFRRLYDDFYGRTASDGLQTGKKRVPPTRPYVQFLMLYDLLKREAKRLMLQTFEGYSAEMLQELDETAKGSAERQLYVLMYRMLAQNEVDSKLNFRLEEIMKDLINPSSTTAKAFRYLKPLSFLP